MSESEILQKCELLKNSSGNKLKRRRHPVESSNESVRGIWSPFATAKHIIWEPYSIEPLVSTTLISHYKLDILYKNRTVSTDSHATLSLHFPWSQSCKRSSESSGKGAILLTLFGARSAWKTSSFENSMMQDYLVQTDHKAHSKLSIPTQAQSQFARLELWHLLLDALLYFYDAIEST